MPEPAEKLCKKIYAVIQYLLAAPEEEPRNIRSTQVDVVKGIAILLVVAGHANFSLSMWCNQYGFHMQLFFLLCGFFISTKSSFFVFVWGKIKSLLLPFYAYLLLIAGLTYLLAKNGIPWQGYGAIANAFTIDYLFVKPFLHNHQFYLALPLWFVSTLFQVMLLVALTRPVLKFFSSRNIWAIVGIILFLLLSQCTIFCAKSITDSFDRGWITRLLIVYGLVSSGYLLWKIRRLWNRTDVLIAGAVLYLILVWNYKPEYTMSWNNYGRKIFKKIFILVSLSGTAACFAVANAAALYKPVNAFLAYCGKKSFHIMAQHMAWIALIYLAADTLKGHDPRKFQFFAHAHTLPPSAVFVLSLLLCLLCCWGLDKIKKSFPVIAFWKKDRKKNS